jgi:hypothetical protein
MVVQFNFLLLDNRWSLCNEARSVDAMGLDRFVVQLILTPTSTLAELASVRCGSSCSGDWQRGKVGRLTKSV